MSRGLKESLLIISIGKYDHCHDEYVRTRLRTRIGHILLYCM